MPPDNPLAPHVAAKIFPGDLVDEREAAAILGAQVQTLRNWRWRNTGPRFSKIGLRMVRYKRADLAAFIEAGSPDKADAA